MCYGIEKQMRFKKKNRAEVVMSLLWKDLKNKKGKYKT